MKSSVRRTAQVLALAVGMGVPLSLTAPAFAGVCSPNRLEDRWLTTTPAKSVAITHAERKSLAPGTGYKRTTSMTASSRVTAAITKSTSASVSGNWFVAAASAEIGISLQSIAEVTAESYFSQDWTIENRTTAQRVYGLYAGTYKVTGKYRQINCNGAGTGYVTTDGTYTSWHLLEDGTIMCGLAYKAGSMEAAAAARIAC